MRHLGTSVLGLVLALGCSKNADPSEKYDPEKEAAERKAADLANVTAAERRGPAFGELPRVSEPPSPPQPGPAYFFVADVGLAVLDGGEFRLIPTPEDRFVHSITTAPDGTVWLGSTKVHRLGEERLLPVGDPAVFKQGSFGNRGLIEWLHVAADGTAWAASDTTLMRWDGSTWSFETVEEIGLGTQTIDGKKIPNHIEQLLVDDEGRPFVRSRFALRVKDGGDWKTIYDGAEDAGPDKAVYLKNVFPTAEGPLIVPWNFGVMKLEGEDLSVTNHRWGKKAFADRVFRWKDTLVSVDYAAVIRAPIEAGAEAEEIRYEHESKGLELGSVRAADLDARGRLWLGTQNGVVIIGADDQITHWPAGAVDAISAQVRVIHVVGSGPELPGVGPVARGSIRGALAKDDAPVVGATVEVCAAPSWFVSGSTATPCKNAPFSKQVKSTAGGAFLIPDVPLNNYGIAVGWEGKWYRTSGASCAGMKPGDTCSVGLLTLRSEK